MSPVAHLRMDTQPMLHLPVLHTHWGRKPFMCVYFRMCFVLRKRRFALLTVSSPILLWPPSLIRDPFDPEVHARMALFSLPPFLPCFPSLINTLIKEPPLTSLDRPSNHCLPLSSWYLWNILVCLHTGSLPFLSLYKCSPILQLWGSSPTQASSVSVCSPEWIKLTPPQLTWNLDWVISLTTPWP